MNEKISNDVFRWAGRTNTGLVNWGTGALNQGAGQGQGGGLGGGDVLKLGGNGGDDGDLREGLQGTPNHPDRLLMGGLLGPRRGGTDGGGCLSRGDLAAGGGFKRFSCWSISTGISTR